MEDVAGRETGDEEEDQRKATHYGVGHVASVDSAQEIARHARWNSCNAMGWRTTEGTVAAPNVEGPRDRATGGMVWESRSNASWPMWVLDAVPTPKKRRQLPTR